MSSGKFSLKFTDNEKNIKSKVIEITKIESEESNKVSENIFPVVSWDSFMQTVKEISDDEIDKNVRVLLSKEKNGSLLNTEITSHLEYFYNTLNLNLKSKLENPFKNHTDYPALRYIGPTD